MTIRQRPFDLPKDLPEALNLADISGINIPHMADWPYRFSSWAMGNPQNAQVWVDETSRMLGWAVMQVPFWAIDCIVHPDAPSHLYPEMLGWAKARASEMTALGKGHPMWFVSIPTLCKSQRRALETSGFDDISEASEDAWSKVLFELANDLPIQSVTPPEGHTMRSLDPHSEIQAYVDLHRAVFQSESMTRDWRLRATCMVDYCNALDIVIASEDGELHGFCVAWLRKLATGEVVGQIEPLGVRESDRGQKLSQCLLSEAILRLQGLGASKIIVETDRQRTAAMAAYASMGFQIAHDVRVYRYKVTAI